MPEPDTTLNVFGNANDSGECGDGIIDDDGGCGDGTGGDGLRTYTDNAYTLRLRRIL
jgi:hypothetical protein